MHKSQFRKIDPYDWFCDPYNKQPCVWSEAVLDLSISCISKLCVLRTVPVNKTYRTPFIRLTNCFRRRRLRICRVFALWGRNWACSRTASLADPLKPRTASLTSAANEPNYIIHHTRLIKSVNSQQYSLKVSVFYIPQLLVLTWMLLSTEESWARFCFLVMKFTSCVMRALSWWVQRRGSVKIRSYGADSSPSAEVRSEAPQSLINPCRLSPSVGQDSLHQTWSFSS